MTSSYPGAFDYRGIMDDFYGYQPKADDDEGRALKRGFQTDMIKKASDQQFAMAQAAQAQIYGMDAMKLDSEMTKDVYRTLNQDAFEYGMKEMAQKYDFESRMAVDDASRELNKMGAMGDIQQNQTKLEGAQNRLTLSEQEAAARKRQREGLEIGGQQQRLTQAEGLVIGGQEQRKTQEQNLRISGQEARETDLSRIGKEGIEQRATIGAKALADEYLLKVGGSEQRLTQDQKIEGESRVQREGLQEGGDQARQTQKEGIQYKATADQETQRQGLRIGGEEERETLGTQIEGQSRIQKEGLRIGGEEERETLGTQIEGQSRIQKEGLVIGGDQERQTIGKTAEEGRTTMDFGDRIEARKENRSEARSRALARR